MIFLTLPLPGKSASVLFLNLLLVCLQSRQLSVHHKNAALQPRYKVLLDDYRHLITVFWYPALSGAPQVKNDYRWFLQRRYLPWVESVCQTALESQYIFWRRFYKARLFHMYHQNRQDAGRRR